jgi:hypothetical protein
MKIMYLCVVVFLEAENTKGWNSNLKFLTLRPLNPRTQFVQGNQSKVARRHHEACASSVYIQRHLVHLHPPLHLTRHDATRIVPSAGVASRVSRTTNPCPLAVFAA